MPQASSMRILLTSDIVSWDGYEELVELLRPDITVLAGDLVSDGYAIFWREAMRTRPWIAGLMNGGAHDEKAHAALVEFLQGEEFRRLRWDLHVGKFYRFIKKAGQISEVLVIRGNHDLDFSGDYMPSVIDETPGCHEISGKEIEVKGLRFLGAGYSSSRAELWSLLEAHRGSVDVLVSHVKWSMVDMLTSAGPSLVLAGHYYSGSPVKRIGKTAMVFTNYGQYAIVDLDGSTRVEHHLYAPGCFGDVRCASRVVSAWL